MPWLERRLWPLIARVALRHLPAALGKSAAAMSRTMAAEADRLERLKRIRWYRITPNGAEVSIEPWTTSLPMLRKAADEAKIFMRDALKTAQPVRQV